jgi:ABC-type dipeptide/oligopeptide/nickel transport system permease component
MHQHPANGMVLIDAIRAKPADVIQVGIIVPVSIVLKHLLQVADILINIIDPPSYAGTASLVI